MPCGTYSIQLKITKLCLPNQNVQSTTTISPDSTWIIVKSNLLSYCVFSLDNLLFPFVEPGAFIIQLTFFLNQLDFWYVRGFDINCRKKKSQTVIKLRRIAAFFRKEFFLFDLLTVVMCPKRINWFSYLLICNCPTIFVLHRK